jgi:hypothetical protein
VRRPGGGGGGGVMLITTFRRHDLGIVLINIGPELYERQREQVAAAAVARPGAHYNKSQRLRRGSAGKTMSASIWEIVVSQLASARVPLVLSVLSPSQWSWIGRCDHLEIPESSINFFFKFQFFVCLCVSIKQTRACMMPVCWL